MNHLVEPLLFDMIVSFCECINIYMNSFTPNMSGISINLNKLLLT